MTAATGSNWLDIRGTGSRWAAGIASTLRVFASAAILCAAMGAKAQADLQIYTDHLVNGFQDWGWGTRNFAAGSPVHSGASSISLNGTAWNVALSLHQNGFDTSPYLGLSFWANGGSGGAQVLHVFARVNGVSTSGVNIGPLPANAWQQYTLSLASLGSDSKTNVDLFTWQLTSNGSTNTFFIDDIRLTARPAPALIHLNVNATQAVRSVDSRWFGCNTAIWDDNFDTTTTISLLKEVGARILRFPGGSISDAYHWRSNYVVGSSWQGWPTRFTNFAHVATNVGAQAIITVNYGCGDADEAADWVRFSNITNNYGFKYWEVGNENYGTWEFDVNTNAAFRANDGWTYAQRAVAYFQKMKAADPTIKVGVVVVPGEESYANGNTSHAATNLLNGQLHYGWTPVLLANLKSFGIKPDFAVHHRYPEYGGSSNVAADCDALLLQSSSGWAGDVADLRKQIVSYFGPEGTNIELVCTENNSDAGNQGRQSTSLVNGLYYAESLAQLMKTELNAFLWWDFRNGTDSNGNFDPTLYGWRGNGDLGMIGGPATKYPPFYAAKLMRYFARAGDTVLSASTDYLLLQSYAARNANGALSVLVVNRDTTTSFNSQIVLNGFAPAPTGTIRSFGIPQDEAARTNGPPQAQDITTNAFNGADTSFPFSFPALSLTLFTFAPAAPLLTVLGPPRQFGGDMVLQLQGQPNVRYILQSSTDLVSWTDFLTNTLSGTTLAITNPVSMDTAFQFYRAAWKQ